MENLNDLIINNQNLIYKIISYFNDYNKEDLFQVGVIGLIKAYKNYNPNYDAKITTYAYPYIVGEIKKYIREDKGIKISRDISTMYLKIEKAYVLLSQKLMHEPSILELSFYLNVPEEIVSEALNSKGALQSLDEFLTNEEKQLTRYDMISIEDKDLDELISLKTEINKLNNFEKTLINERYFNDLTQQEVSSLLGISQVQVSRNEQKVLKKLKDKLAA